MCKKVFLFIIFLLSFILCIEVDAKELDEDNYIITSKLNNNFVVDLHGAKIQNSRNIQLYTSNGSAAQEWYFSKGKDGYYTISSSSNHNYVLDISGAKFRDLSNVQLYKKNGSNAQKWKLEKDSMGYYTIVSYNSKYVLDIAGARTSNGTNIQIYSRNNTDAQKFAINKVVVGKKTISEGVYNIKTTGNNYLDIVNGHIENKSDVIVKSQNKKKHQKWYVEYLGNGYYSIKSFNNYTYSLDVISAGKIPKSNVDLYSSNGTDAQKWIIKSSSNGTYKIYSKTNGLCLDINSDIDGASVFMNEENSSSTQNYIFTKVTDYASKIEDGYYTITTKLSNNKVIDLAAANTSNKANIQVYESNDSNAQKWYFKLGSDGYYTISTAANLKFVLDINGAKFSNSTNVQLYEKNGSNAQKWKLIEEDDGYYQIVSYDERYVLDIAGGKAVDKTNVQIYVNNDSAAQKFALNKVVTGEKTIDDGIYTIADSNKALFDIDNSNVLTRTNTESNSSKWYIKYLDNGYYSICSYGDIRYALNVSNNGKVYGSNVDLYTNNNLNSEQWIIRLNSDNSYSIISRSAGLSLDINNSNVYINKTNNNSNSQKLYLTKIENFGTKTIENGYYFINSKLNTLKSVDVNGGTMAENTNVQLYDSNSSIAQKWYIEYIENGYYKILANKDSTYSLTSDNKYASNVKISNYNNSDTQKWVIRDSGDGYYSILNSNYYSLSVDNSSTVNKTNISLSQTYDFNNQKFKIVKTADGVSNQVLSNGYYFINSALNTDYVVDLSSAKTANKTNIQLYTKNQSDAQKWYLTYIGNGYYKITSALSGSKSLDVQAAGMANGTNVQIYDYNGSYAQQWIIRDAGDGNFYIISNNGGNYLDVANSIAGNGSNIEMNSYTAGQSQKFSFTKTMLEKIVIDVSAHQGRINWSQVASSGIYGVILRISAGCVAEDTELANNIAEVKKYKIPYGIYIYSYAENYSEGIMYGQYTNKIINKYGMNPTLGVYFDLESNGITKNIGPATYTEIVKGYMSQVPNARLYTYTNYANTALNTAYLRSLITWIADYRGYCGYTGYYNMWQYTSSGRIAGINGNVDMSILYFR